MRGWARLPIQRIVVSAQAVPRTPTRAARTAERRWEDVTVEKSPGADEVLLVIGKASEKLLARGAGEEVEKKELG